MRRILLARHGETSWNAIGRLQGHTDIELNEVGRDQALRLAQRLASAGVSEVWTSDLARARQTGEIVAAKLGLATPQVDRELRERHFGVFEGLTRDECQAQHPEVGSFAALSNEQQIEFLKQVDRTPFFERVRLLTLVGMFAMPKYGGNRDGVGWKLLGFQDQHIFTPPFGYYDRDYPGFKIAVVEK